MMSENEIQRLNEKVDEYFKSQFALLNERINPSEIQSMDEDEISEFIFDNIIRVEYQNGIKLEDVINVTDDVKNFTIFCMKRHVDDTDTDTYEIQSDDYYDGLTNKELLHQYSFMYANTKVAWEGSFYNYASTNYPSWFLGAHSLNE
jgi:uncharacterized protein with gpF-like domain